MSIVLQVINAVVALEIVVILDVVLEAGYWILLILFYAEQGGNAGYGGNSGCCCNHEIVIAVCGNTGNYEMVVYLVDSELWWRIFILTSYPILMVMVASDAVILETVEII